MFCDSLHALFLTQSWLTSMMPFLIARKTLLTARLKAIHFSWLGPELFVCCLAHQGSTGVFLLLQTFSDVVWRPALSIAGQLIVSVSPRFLFLFVVYVIKIYLFVLDDLLTS